MIWIIITLLFIILPLSIRVIYQYEEGVLFTFGKYSKLLKPGLRFIIPVIQTVKKIDKRIRTIDIPKQEVITKDNVSVKVNAVVYFRVRNSKDAVLNIRDYQYAIAQYALTALRDVIGSVTLDELLANRDEIAEKIEKIVDKETDEWGIDVTSIKMQDIEIAENMKRTMAKIAEADRERRATILKSEGEVIASKNLAKAAENLSKSPGGLHLRTLQTINDISSDQSNTIIVPIPLEILKSFEGYEKNKKKN